MLLKGRYELLRQLSPKSRLARDTRSGRQVVAREVSLRGLKSWEALSRLEGEAKSLSRVSHPAVPAYVDSFTLDEASADPKFYLIREHVEGELLSERRARPTQDELFALSEKLLVALGELHRLSPPLLHGDLSPKRILIRPS